jgi:precorrin-6Y C5,15-methyltransferase (decarboxylating)
MSEPLVVVGIGRDGPAGLSPQARAHVSAARVLAGGRRHLDFFPNWEGEKLVLAGEGLAAFVGALKERYPRVKTVVLASGDPLFYGIGRALLEVIPKEDLLFLPHLSSVQLAFSRVKESWHDASVVSLHGRPPEALVEAIEARAAKIAVLTDARNHPAAIAELLRRHGAADEYSLWVCEDLGGPDERVSRHSPADLGQETFSPLNVVILLRSGHSPVASGLDVPLLGIPESALLRRPGPRGMITRREVRLMALCHLELFPGDVLWDVGAGSGSVSLEAARLSPRLRLFAIERDEESFARLTANVARFGRGQVTAIHAEAPEGLAGLPDPDAVFIGGSGGRLPALLQAAASRLRPAGRLVLNCITLEALSRGWEGLCQLGLQPEVTSVQLARSRPLGRLHGLEPDKPLFILRARKP